MTRSVRAHTLEYLTMSKIILRTIAEIVAGIRGKTFSPVEVVDAHLERVAEVQPKLNAFVYLDGEAARRQARLAEAAVMRGDRLGPLHGVPVTIKSCMDVAGWPAAAGSLLRKDYVAQMDAPLVERLRGAGAILLGNTNTPEYLMAYETDNSLNGKTSNPWNLERSAGGSSGGEAAAIASGCSAGGVGSDGGGSIRVPAHFCGIGVVGPMARTVADVRALFEVMAGPDAGDALSAPVPVQAVTEKDVRGLRVGILQSDALGTMTAETAAAVERAANILSEQGFVVEKKSLNGLDRAIEVWWYFFGPVIADSIRKGAAGHEAELSPMLREYVELATAEMVPTYDGFLAACGERDKLRWDIVRQMEDVRILLSPVSAGPAFRHGEGNWRAGEKENYRDTMRYSQWLNLAGLPGVAVPLGVAPEGLPIGVQVIGRPYEEELILAVAEAIDRGRGLWQAPSI